MSSKDSLGDRMKRYEAPSIDRRAFKGQPVIIRLDGKRFHKFCEGLDKPFDRRLTDAMVSLTDALFNEFQATLGYTQSDEITLVWITETHGAKELPFGGRYQKLESVTASFASAYFSKLIASHIPEKMGQLAMFDARAFVVPDKVEAANALIWRQQDAVKNALSALAHSHFDHGSLQNLNGPQLNEKLWREKGINFNDMPWDFKRGTFVRRATVEFKRENGEVYFRRRREHVDIWITKQAEPVHVLFHEAVITPADQCATMPA